MDKLRPLGYGCPDVFLCRLITEILLFSKGCVKKKKIKIYIYIYIYIYKNLEQGPKNNPPLIGGRSCTDQAAKNIDVRRRSGFTKEVEQTWS
jgi:hypothetical protein